MKRIVLILAIIGIASTANCLIIRKNITQAKLNRVVLERIENINADTGEKTLTIQIKAHGEYVDEDGNIAGGAYKTYELKDLSPAAKDQLIQMFKGLSRKLNNDLAFEDAETF